MIQQVLQLLPFDYFSGRREGCHRAAAARSRAATSDCKRMAKALPLLTSALVCVCVCISVSFPVPTSLSWRARLPVCCSSSPNWSSNKKIQLQCSSEAEGTLGKGVGARIQKQTHTHTNCWLSLRLRSKQAGTATESAAAVGNAERGIGFSEIAPDPNWQTMPPSPSGHGPRELPQVLAATHKQTSWQFKTTNQQASIYCTTPLKNMKRGRERERERERERG